MKIISTELQQEIWYTIRNNKRRTMVTALGVFTGMFFFIVLTGLGEGIRNAITNAVEGSSSEQLSIFTGRTTLPYQGYKANRKIPITYKDYLDIDMHKENLRLVSAIAGWGGGFNNVRITSNGKSKSVFVAGMVSTFSQTNTQIVVYGRDLKPDELDRGDPVCVVGYETAKDLYNNKPENAVGNYLSVGGIAFRIVGIIKPFSDSFKMGIDLNYIVQVPISYAINSDPSTDVFLNVIPKKGVTDDMAEEEIFRTISRNHHVDPRDKNVVNSISMEVFLNIFDMIINVISILMWVVGLGTLFTGVIGVSNILLVTVRERQREIGVRRALGARPDDIRNQFMLEALLIILLAGMAGLISGLAVTLAVGAISESVPGMTGYMLRPYPQPWMLLFSMIVMAICGVLAGLLPVYKALQVKAIEAIRDE